MRILILNWRDQKHPLAGGAEQSLLEHAKYWRKKGAEIIWFSSFYKGAKKTETVDGIKFIRQGSHYTVHARAYLYYKKYLFNSIDIIIDNFHGIPFFAPIYFNDKKIIALINEPAKEVWFKNIIWPLSVIAYYAEPHFFFMYKNIPFITSASSIVNELQKLGIAKKNINNIAHGVTVERPNPILQKEEHPTLLYLSQVSPDKGIEDALIAFKKVKLEMPKAVFWIVGKAISEKYQMKIFNLARELELTESTIFYGFVKQSEKFRLLQKAWVLVHPSIREGWGLNVIEANTYGIPAVGYNVTGLQDSIKNGVTGLLTESNTPDDLSEKIIKLMNKKENEKFSDNAKKWSTQFTWEKAGRKSWQLIKKVYEESK